MITLAISSKRVLVGCVNSAEVLAKPRGVGPGCVQYSMITKLSAPYISFPKFLLITEAKDAPRTTGSSHNCGLGPGLGLVLATWGGGESGSLI